MLGLKIGLTDHCAENDENETVKLAKKTINLKLGDIIKIFNYFKIME
jgi:hypothetical protein